MDMAEPMISTGQAGEPELRKHAFDPRGVMQKNLKPLLYLGAALLVIVAALFSSRQKPSSRADVSGVPPQPIVQDNTENNVQALKEQLAAERQKQADQAAMGQAGADPTLPSATPQQRAASAAYGLTGQPAPYDQQNGRLSAAQQEAEQLAARERERAFDARFSSNIAYSRSAAEATEPKLAPQVMPSRESDPQSSLVASRKAGEAPKEDAATKRRPEVNVDSAVGQPYLLYEGTTLDAVLMNRLDGDAVGPVKVLVSNPVYSHDRQHVLIPDGTIVLGEARKIGAAGFGQQRRLAVIFHRLIMPDGYSVDLDQFQGLDQIGEQGLKDKVNNHYLQIFGTSIALGVIAGSAQVSEGGGVYAGSGPQVFTNGASASVSQSATTVLDRFIQIPPTITIREGHRVKVYFTQDMLLPAYENHTIPESF
jgi:type IV secretory pathway VirB10-like protein